MIHKEGKNELLKNKRVLRIDANSLLVLESAEYDSSGFCIYYKDHTDGHVITRKYDNDGKELYSTTGIGKEYKMYDESGRLVESIGFDVFNDYQCCRGVFHTFYEYDKDGNLIRKYDKDRDTKYTYNGPNNMMDSMRYFYEGKEEDFVEYSYEFIDNGGYKRFGISIYNYIEIIKYDKYGNIISYYFEDEDLDRQTDRYVYNREGLEIYHLREGEFESKTNYDDKGRKISSETTYFDSGRVLKYYAEYNADGLMVRDGYEGSESYIYAYENMTWYLV